MRSVALRSARVEISRPLLQLLRLLAVAIRIGQMLLGVPVRLGHAQLRFGALPARSRGLLRCGRPLGLSLRRVLPRLQQMVARLSLIPLGRLLLSGGSAPTHLRNQHRGE